MTTTIKIFIIPILTTLIACNSQTKKVELDTMPVIETRSYLEINNQVQEILRKNNGNFPIIVYDKAKGTKHLIYLGEQHGNDPTDNRFDTIQKYFSLFNPTILLNEGGQIADSVHFKNRADAIKKKGTIGFLKYLADNSNLKLINADCPDSIEVSSLLRKYDRNKILYVLVVQRFIPQFLSGYDEANDLKTEYEKFTRKYLTSRCKFELSENENQWEYFEKLYEENNNGKNIDLKNFDLSQTEYYLYDKGLLGNIGRSSLQIRDSVIIENIYKTLQNHDKVFIVFGAAHLLAQKPTLDKIFEK